MQSVQHDKRVPSAYPPTQFPYTSQARRLGRKYESRTAHIARASVKSNAPSSNTDLFTCITMLVTLTCMNTAGIMKFLRSPVPSFTSLPPACHINFLSCVSRLIYLVRVLQCCHTITQFGSLVFGFVLPCIHIRAGTGQWNRLRAGRSAVPIPAEAKDLLFSETLRLTPEPTQPLIQCVPGTLSRW
jgi:hypothetical protein